MKDLIRSPLQFVRPMTNEEWQDLVLRAGHREEQRIKRRRSHAKANSAELGNGRRNELTRSASSAAL